MAGQRPPVMANPGKVATRSSWDIRDRL